MKMRTPRLVVAGLSGDSGKTIVSLGLLIALRRKGLTVAPFKKGPDYIDPAWLGALSGVPCRNLDTYLVEPPAVLRSFAVHAARADIALIEGNRGLFDGQDVSGSHSTAGLARLLQAPLLLVVDATKATRTVAALVRGCQVFEDPLPLAGVVLNKVAGPRHETVIRSAVETACGVPVLGSIPRLGDDASLLPGRHLGLVPPAEFQAHGDIERKLVDLAACLDLDSILAAAATAAPLDTPEEQPAAATGEPVNIGYLADSVFTFYYPENLEALRRLGARLIPVSSLADSGLPDIDALYIGGGFPETHAERLTQNRSLMESVSSAADRGLPIYAECGGLIYLCRSLKWNETVYPMAGVFPVDLTMNSRPIGHGYTLMEVDRPNPFYDAGTTIKGHEFHYSGPVAPVPESSCCLKMHTGVGLGGHRDGLVSNNVLACFTHIHAEGTRQWAPAMVQQARRYAAGRGGRAATDYNRSAVKNAGSA